MRKIFYTTMLAVLMLCLVTPGLSQNTNPFGNSGSFTGALGLTVIDDQSYLTINLRPDLALGKFGIGLNVNLLYNTNSGAIRSEDWDEKYDWARLIRYMRYGRKGDQFYTKIGTMDAARLGHGFIMNYYTNEASYDERKIGLALDIDFGTFGFESVTNNLGRLEIIGGRAFVRPLRPYIDVPIIKNLTLGATFVSDVDPDGRRGTEDAFNAFGLDVELPIITTSLLRTYTYFDWAKLDTFGTGIAFGVATDLRLIAGIAEVTARLERRFLGKEFMPAYFDAFYEIQRFQSETGVRKSESLAFIQEETRGTFGELVGHILNTVQLVGNYQWLDDPPHYGMLYLAAETKQNVPMFALQATYNKMGVANMKDAFTLDDRSIARLGIGYKVKPYLVLFMDYIYTFRFDIEEGRYKSQERYSPRVAFVYNFGF